MGPAIVGLPILIKYNIHGSLSDFAFAEGCMAAGALLGSFIIPKLSKRFTNGFIWGIGLFLDGITYSILYWASSIEIIMIILFFHGIGIPLIIISRTSIIQINTKNRYYGRLFSIIHLGVVGTTAISSGLVGIVSTIISIKLLFFVIGIGAALCGLLLLGTSSLRKLN